MKLFYAPGSSSLLPHIVLYEAGLPFAAVKINEHTKKIEGGGDYRKVNPLGYVPALGGVDKFGSGATLNCCP
jgi:glutathione S-transferase